MFYKPKKLEEKSKLVFITYEDTTQLWLSFVFTSWTLNEFFNVLFSNLVGLQKKYFKTWQVGKDIKKKEPSEKDPIINKEAEDELEEVMV